MWLGDRRRILWEEWLGDLFKMFACGIEALIPGWTSGLCIDGLLMSSSSCANCVGCRPFVNFPMGF
jgi:hypothetical protein